MVPFAISGGISYLDQKLQQQQQNICCQIDSVSQEQAGREEGEQSHVFISGSPFWKNSYLCIMIFTGRLDSQDFDFHRQTFLKGTLHELNYFLGDLMT